MARLNKKRLSVDLPDILHKQLKRLSEKYNITITRYLIRIIIERLKLENDWDKE